MNDAIGGASSDSSGYGGLKRMHIETMAKCPPDLVEQLRRTHPRDWLVLQRINQGDTYKAIAEDFGVTIERVRQLAARGARLLLAMQGWRKYGKPQRWRP